MVNINTTPSLEKGTGKLATMLRHPDSRKTFPLLPPEEVQQGRSPPAAFANGRHAFPRRENNDIP